VYWGVAVTADGMRAVSSFADNALKLRNHETGLPLLAQSQVPLRWRGTVLLPPPKFQSSIVDIQNRVGSVPNPICGALKIEQVSSRIRFSRASSCGGISLPW
jgi:hypothetical protein